ncbi:hypothetical protein AOLI_G00035710 [Acnodon oligacanthus]
MGNTADCEGSHLFQTPSTSPTALTPPRLPSLPALNAQSFDTVIQDSIIPATGGTNSPSCSPQCEATVLEDAASPAEEGRGPSGYAEGEMVAVQEMALTLLRLLEQHGPSLGLCSGPAGAAGLLKSLLAEREKMVAEIQSLKETLKTERAEWEQFQSDLQVAVSVADRLRLEAEEALKSFLDTHTDTEQRLVETAREQSLREKELESMKVQLTETQQTLYMLTVEHQRTLTELDMFRERSKIKPCKDQQTMEKSQTGADKEKRNQGAMSDQRSEWRVESLEPKTEECELKTTDSQKLGETEESEECPKGQQETEDRRREEGSPVREPRRIIMLSERSRSLSQILLPAHSSSVLLGSSQNLTGTASPIKSQEAVKGRRTPEWLLQRQDSWSRSLRGKDDDPGSDSLSPSSSKIRPQDGFSLLLRRHGGSRRNSLLRWCQTRTQGYRNIEITNFSSSWEDGLAFCAVYHSYLPTHISYSSLKAEEKRQNLDLAFHTGESVGIKATLTVEEMLRDEGPDWQRVLGYVESMYRHFEM